MLPVVYVAGALASRAPGVISAIASRLGVKSTAASIVGYARSNPVVFASVAATAVAAGDAAWDFVSESPELLDAVQKLAKSVSHKADALSVNDIQNIESYRDELEIIKDAALQMGSLDRLIALRKALALPDEYYGLYRNLRSLRLS